MFGLVKQFLLGKENCVNEKQVSFNLFCFMWVRILLQDLMEKERIIKQHYYRYLQLFSKQNKDSDHQLHSINQRPNQFSHCQFTQRNPNQSNFSSLILQFNYLTNPTPTPLQPHSNPTLCPMKIFRTKYLYNSQNPIFANANVKTYNCMDTEKKDNRLLLLQHLIDPPEVQPDKSTLQPYQYPTISEPFSVYPLVNCCSEIGKINENDAMYILQCLVASKTKKPLYYVITPQGIACSEVEGLLPNRSPGLFQLALDLLDLEPTLIEVEKSVVSRQGYAVCKAIRDGVIDAAYFDTYGWKDAKKDVNLTDEKFWIFKGRRKEPSPFGNQEYALAWNSTYGLSRFKHIDLTKDSYQPQFQQDFNTRIRYYEQHSTSKTITTLTIHRVVKDLKGIKIFTSLANQGNLQDYVEKKLELGQKVTQYSMLSLLENFVGMMRELVDEEGSNVRGHTAIHAGNLYVHDNRFVLGEPVFVTDKKEKKLRDLKKTYDWFAPEFKENIILPEKLFRLDQEKIDVWAFGFMLYFMFTRESLNFDAGKNPIIKRGVISTGMAALIKKCLNQDPQLRPTWREINLRSLPQDLQVSQYNQQQQQQQQQKKPQQIRLDSPSRQKKLRANASTKQPIIIKQNIDSQRQLNSIPIKEEQAQLIKEQEEQVEQRKQKEYEYMLPPQISSKLKRIKLTIKLIIIMVMYLIVFFGPFLENSFQILLLKGQLQKTPLNLVSNTGTTLSSVTILSAESKFFLYNDISFSQVQNKYHCINDKFDPINNPDYSLFDYVKSTGFEVLIYMGWVGVAVICVIKGLSVWKGGIANRPRRNNKRFWVVYAFQELSLASLLFAHFFIFQFFYFSGISPCFSIEDYSGVEPLFDSSLYLFLRNQTGYMTKVFSTLGILSIILTISGCFYAFAPKFDYKYFLSVPSILFRFVPYILLLLICRIGVFSLFSPTALNDSTSIIASIITSTSKGFFGIVPEVFVGVCVAIEVVLELMLYYCEQKASQSDKLSKMFNLSEIKSLKRNGSYGSYGGGMDRSLNQMSLDNSMQQLEA